MKSWLYTLLILRFSVLKQVRIWLKLDLLHLYKTSQSVSRSGSFGAFSANILIQRLKSSPDLKVFVHFLSLLYSRVKKTSNKLFQRKGNDNLSLQIKFCFTFRLLCSWCVSTSFFSKQNWKESMEALYMRKRTHKLHTDTFKAEITNTKQFCTRNN